MPQFVKRLVIGTSQVFEARVHKYMEGCVAVCTRNSITRLLTRLKRRLCEPQPLQRKIPKIIGVALAFVFQIVSKCLLHCPCDSWGIRYNFIMIFLKPETLNPYCCQEPDRGHLAVHAGDAPVDAGLDLGRA